MGLEEQLKQLETQNQPPDNLNWVDLTALTRVWLNSDEFLVDTREYNRRFQIANASLDPDAWVYLTEWIEHAGFLFNNQPCNSQPKEGT